MNYSAEQLEIFNWFKSGTGNLVIEAYAGTGKTTTIKEAFQHAHEPRMLYAVFNVRNKKEAEEKITDYRVDVKTLHSLGFGFVRNNWRGSKPDSEVEADRVDSIANLSNFPEERASILKLIGLAKNTCLNISESDLEYVADQRDIEFSKVDGIGIAFQAIELAKKPDAKNRISFDDMVWLPCAMGWVRPQYDLVVIDEAQDMSMPQLTMAKQASKGRVVVVGDSRQSIYSFRGSVQNAMGMMQATLRAKTLTLSTTYRCPKSVVRLAREIVPLYNAAESAPEGEVLNSSDTSGVVPGDVILSRLNAPLMPAALALLRKNVPARIEGRDIGKQLVAMVDSFKSKSVPHFMEKVQSWLDKQTKRFEKVKGGEKRIEQQNDIAQSLIAVAESATSVADIKMRLLSLFQDTDGNSKLAVVLSTVHKFKGMEADNVFVLMSTMKDSTDEDRNIKYVAFTRSKSKLILVA